VGRKRSEAVLSVKSDILAFVIDGDSETHIDMIVPNTSRQIIYIHSTDSPPITNNGRRKEITGRGSKKKEINPAEAVHRNRSRETLL